MPNPHDQQFPLIEQPTEDKNDATASVPQSSGSSLFLRMRPEENGCAHHVLSLTSSRQQRRPRPINTEQLNSYQQTGCRDERSENATRARTNTSQELLRNQTPTSLPDSTSRRPRRR